MVEMRDDDTVFVRGVWVPFGHKRINEIFKLKDLKHGSKLKKKVDNPSYDKILNLLTDRQGKWEATKKTHTMPSVGGPSQKKPKYGFTSSARSSSQQNIYAK